MSHGRPGDFAVFGAPVVWRGMGLSDADFCHAVGHDNDVGSGSQVAAADAAAVDAVDGCAFGSNDAAVVGLFGVFNLGVCVRAVGRVFDFEFARRRANSRIYKFDVKGFQRIFVFL